MVLTIAVITIWLKVIFMILHHGIGLRKLNCIYLLCFYVKNETIKAHTPSNGVVRNGAYLKLRSARNTSKFFCF
jgi:hypothetical protein